MYIYVRMNAKYHHICVGCIDMTSYEDNGRQAFDLDIFHILCMRNLKLKKGICSRMPTIQCEQKNNRLEHNFKFVLIHFHAQ